MRLTPTLLALTVAIPSALADDVRVDGIEVVDTGIYRVVLGEETKDPGLPTEKIIAVDGSELVEATTTVPGQLGLEFGLRYTVVGGPDDAEVTLDFRFVYPPPGLNDPEETEPLTESRFSRQRTIGKIEYTGYGFENAWEIVPGTWTIEISHGGTKLAEQSFTVTE